MPMVNGVNAYLGQWLYIRCEVHAQERVLISCAGTQAWTLEWTLALIQNPSALKHENVWG